MMDLLERPRKVRQHQPGANHYDTLERDRMAAEQSTHTTAERWLPVPGYEGYYEVSDLGRVWSVPRVVQRRNGISMKAGGKLLTGGKDPLGYKYMCMTVDSQKKIYRFVHRLVMSAFVGPCPDGMEVCHNNGDPADNRLVNLRYDTPAANNQDTIKHGTNHSANKTHCPRGHELAYQNLMPSQLLRGKRSCLACSRATARVRSHPEMKSHFKEISDQYHAAILKNAGGAS